MYNLFFNLEHRIGRAKFWCRFLMIEAIFAIGELILGQWMLGLNPNDLTLAPEQLAEPRYL